jgi:predicted O-methyltransferase YrrM
MSGAWLSWQSLRAAVGPAKRAVFGTVPRAKKDYATHVPVLIGLASSLPIKRVLELGCGEFSTLTFLNRSVFRELELLDSYENDRSWLQRISELTANDSRVRTHYAEGEMARAIRDLSLDVYDLIFIDDSTSAQQRAMTIEEIAARRCKSLVVIHDFEVQEYQKAASAFEHCFTFKAYNPMTGVVWNGDQARGNSMKQINGLLKRSARALEPDDVAAWTRVFF